MNLHSFMLADTLYSFLHVSLVDKSLQFHLFRIHNISLVHPTLPMSFQYTIKEEYFAIRSDGQYISFPISTDIMACQVSNGQFCQINTPLWTVDTSKSCSYALFIQIRNKINTFYTLSVINQTHDKAVNINDNFRVILTLENTRKLYIICLHFSYLIAL